MDTTQFVLENWHLLRIAAGAALITLFALFAIFCAIAAWARSARGRRPHVEAPRRTGVAGSLRRIEHA